MEQPARPGLAGQRVVITGAASGIGLATARRFAAEGARVVILDWNREALDRSLAENPGISGGVLCDVSQPDQVAQGFAEVDTILGGVDVLIANAGISVRNAFRDLEPGQWARVIGINLTGAFLCAREAAGIMVRQGGGVIVNVSSVSRAGNFGQTSYSASKAGQIAFTKSLAREVASRNITVNAVAAGYVDTDIWAKVPEDIKVKTVGLIPMGRKGKPSDIAHAVAFLASDDASYITGHVLTVDGGMVMF